MEIIERKENPLLNRVELSFQWDHSNGPTPSLIEMVDAAAKSEPGSNRDLVFVKNVETRFGMSRTTGLALVYETEDSASLEQEFVRKRHRRGGVAGPHEGQKEPEADSGESSDDSGNGGDE
ncbi:MAG: hypothetical protein QF911_03335 [Candidatus Thalassarchaeaceae archaeon]|jgi:small subunit ribosomal protein S24e|nr:hypothetical protein [Candidatus Thalassarchaeaceae archaeon]